MRDGSFGPGEFTIRFNIWQMGGLIGYGITTAIGVVAAVFGGTVMLLLPVMVIVLVWIFSRMVRMEITATVVRAKQWQGQGDVEAPRDAIREIRYFPLMISFRGEGDEPLMEPRPHWTLRQMTMLANELSVPLYDHRGLLGLEELKVGRLVNDQVLGRRQ